ncbi:hypothetical protein BG452_32295 [Streptomyces sp. CBMA123]|nr:hypothetical protein [Streptomyces sp. CBMA123]
MREPAGEVGRVVRRLVPGVGAGAAGGEQFEAEGAGIDVEAGAAGGGEDQTGRGFRGAVSCGHVTSVGGDGSRR